MKIMPIEEALKILVENEVLPSYILSYQIPKGMIDNIIITKAPARVHNKISWYQ